MMWILRLGSHPPQLHISMILDSSKSLKFLNVYIQDKSSLCVQFHDYALTLMILDREDLFFFSFHNILPQFKTIRGKDI